LAYRGRHSEICKGALLDIPLPADFGGFYYDPASNLLANRTVIAAIYQRSLQPLREEPTLANRLDAKSQQNPTDLENLFLHRQMLSLRWGIFLAEKGLATFSLGLIYHSGASTTIS
jgi:hypothetical protein